MTGLPTSVQAFVDEAPIYRRPIAEIVQTVAQESPAGTRVLDAGSGSQPYRPLFAHCEYTTQDWSESPHPQAEQADIVGDLAALPVEDERFDLIVCTEVLEHVSDPAGVLEELHRVTARGGRILITVPFVIGLHEEPHDHFRYTSHGLRGLLERAGFDQVDVQPLTGWFSTIAALMRNAHGAIEIPGQRAPATFLVGATLRVLSEPAGVLARLLDRFDRRRSLPTGWSAVARRPL